MKNRNQTIDSDRITSALKCLDLYVYYRTVKGVMRWSVVRPADSVKNYGKWRTSMFFEADQIAVGPGMGISFDGEKWTFAKVETYGCMGEDDFIHDHATFDGLLADLEGYLNEINNL